MRYCSLAGGEVTITRLGRSPSRRSPRAFVGQLKKRRELLTKYVPRWEPLDSWAFSSFFAKLDCLRSVAVGVAVFFFFCLAMLKRQTFLPTLTSLVFTISGCRSTRLF